MDNIYAIVISDFIEKIHFFHKKLAFDYEDGLRIVKSTNKSLASNFLKDFVSNGLEMRLIDMMVNPQMRMKISIIGEVLIEIIYDSTMDSNYINTVNHNLLEILFFIGRTKRIKIDLLNRKFGEVYQVLEDSLYLLDPRVRFNLKNFQFNLKESQNHSMYAMKFNVGAGNLKNLCYHQSSKEFNHIKENLQNNKKLKSKNLQMFIPLNKNLVKIMRMNKNIHKKDFAISPEKKVNMIKVNKVNQNDIPKNNKEGDILSEIDFNIPAKIYQGASSFHYNQNVIIHHEQKNNVDKKFVLNNLADLATLDFAQIDKNLKDINSAETKNYQQKRNSTNIEKSLQSLEQVDLAGVLEIINFDKNSNNTQIVMNNYTIQTDLLISSSKNPNSADNSFVNLSNDQHRFSTNKIPSVDFTGNNPKFYPGNIFQLSNNNIKLKETSDKPKLDIDNFENLLSINMTQDEDKIERSLIRKQIRGVIIEKGILMNNKGKYEDVKYRGQIALELTNNFEIKNKSFFLKIFHPNWNDSNCFLKQIPDRNIVEDQHHGNYKLTCHNVKSFLRLIDYNINIKMVDPAADFKVSGTFKEDKYKLEIKSAINTKMATKMKSSQMNIVIITKSSQINILKATNDSYKIEDKVISFTINDFNKEERWLIGIVFSTSEKEFVEVVKITYRYMDLLPTSNNGELIVYDEFNQPMELDVVKKSLVEIRFIP